MKRKFLIGLLVLLLLPYITIKAVVSGDISLIGNITGVVGFELENYTLDIEIDSIGGISFDDTAIEVGDDISFWFTNLPDNLNATVTEVDMECVTVKFSGQYTEVTDQKIQVSIPSDVLIGTPDDLDNLENDNAKFIATQNIDAYYHDAYTVSGKVGQEIEVQKVYIDTEELVENSNILDIEIEYTNGLKGKITNITSTGAGTYTKQIEVTFTGTPTMEDHSQITYTLYKNGLMYVDNDVIIPTRVDVIFDITQDTNNPPTPPHNPPYIPPYTPVLTGID